MFSALNATAPASGDVGNEGGEVRRARLMQIDLDVDRARNRNRNRRMVAIQPNLLVGALPQAVSCFLRVQGVGGALAEASTNGSPAG